MSECENPLRRITGHVLAQRPALLRLLPGEPRP